MGVLSRFKDIMSSNVNALLDKAEDPQKMIDQSLRNAEDSLAKVKADTSSVMAEEKSAKRKLDECDSEIAKMTEYAKKAVAAGNDDDARQFLTKKGELSSKREGLAKSYEIAKDNATKIRQMHDKLEKDISEMRSKRDMLKAKLQVAETQQKINKIGTSAKNARSGVDTFSRMESKIDKMLDEADATMELNQSSFDNDIDDLASKYDSGAVGSSIDDELAALKASMNPVEDELSKLKEEAGV